MIACSFKAECILNSAMNCLINHFVYIEIMPWRVGRASPQSTGKFLVSAEVIPGHGSLGLQLGSAQVMDDCSWTHSRSSMVSDSDQTLEVFSFSFGKMVDQCCQPPPQLLWTGAFIG